MAVNKTIGRNTNQSDFAEVTDVVEVTVNTAVSVAPIDKDRIYFSISITSKDAYIRFMPATTQPSERKGIYLKKDQIYEMPTDNIYTGEVSIINKKNNEKPKFSITTF